jgi:transposase
MQIRASGEQMTRRKSMRKIKECLRLFHEARLSRNQIAKALKLSRSTVQDYFNRFKEAGLAWTELLPLPDAELESRLFKKAEANRQRPEPDAAYIHAELRRRGVTLQLLWEEYRKEHADALGYTQFCERYHAFSKSLKVYLRQTHVGGERAYVDYSGFKPTVVDAETGEVRSVEIFVLCWGASHCLYAEAQESQSLENWVMGHVRAFEFFGCVPHAVVPDNLKAAVTKAHLYDPDLNATYCSLAEHYGFAVLPARPYKPKDKAKAEVGVQIVQRWIVAALRHYVFHTVSQLNAKIRELLGALNERPMKRLRKARWELFQEWDLPKALPLPQERFVFHTWQKAKVGIDYCVQVERHYYSVPYIHAGRDLDVRLAEGKVEVFLKGERLAQHRRSAVPYGYTILPEHMPERHRKHLSWTPHRLLAWAEKVGPHTRRLIECLLKKKTHVEMAYRPALGILRLSEAYGRQRLEKASQMALEANLLRVSQISQILKRGLDKAVDEGVPEKTVAASENVRGAAYFQERMAL